MHRDSYFETLRPVWTPANGDSTSTLEDTSAGIEDKGLNSLPSNITRDRTPSLLYYKEFNALPSNIGGWHVRPQAVRSLRSPIEKTTSQFELLYRGFCHGEIVSRRCESPRVCESASYVQLHRKGGSTQLPSSSRKSILLSALILILHVHPLRS